MLITAQLSTDGVNFYPYTGGSNLHLDNLKTNQTFYIKYIFQGFSSIRFRSINTTNRIYNIDNNFQNPAPNQLFTGNYIEFTIGLKIKKGEIGLLRNFIALIVISINGSTANTNLDIGLNANIIPNPDYYKIAYNIIEQEPIYTAVAGVIYLPPDMPNGTRFKVQFELNNILGDKYFYGFTDISPAIAASNTPIGWLSSSENIIYATFEKFEGMDSQNFIGPRFALLENNSDYNEYRFYFKIENIDPNKVTDYEESTQSPTELTPESFFEEYNPIPKNWFQRVIQRIEYKTAITTTQDGFERRQPVFDAPREYHEFLGTFANNKESVDFISNLIDDRYADFKYIDELNTQQVFTYFNKDYDFEPILYSYNNPLSIGQYLVHNEDGYKIFNVSSVSPNDKVLSTGEILNRQASPEYDDISYKVIEQKDAFIRDLNINHLSDYFIETKLKVELKQHNRSVKIDELEYYDNYPLFKIKANWRELPTTSISPNYEELESEQGVVLRTKLYQNNMTRSYLFTLTRDQVDYFQSLFHECKGSCYSFLMTDEVNSLLYKKETFTNTIELENNKSFTALKPFIHSVKITFNDNSFVFKEVLNIEEDEEKSLITLNSIQVIDYTLVKDIKPVYFTRFFGDLLSIEWINDDVANINCVFKLVKM